MKNSFFWDIYAKLYDTLNVLQPYQELQRQVLEALNLNGNEKILDAGCGTGNFELFFSYAYKKYPRQTGRLLFVGNVSRKRRY